MSDYAEATLVAKTLLDPKCFSEADLLPEMFQNPRYREIWISIKNLQGGQVDVFTIAADLQSRGKPLSEVDLTELIVKYETAAPVKSFVDTIKEDWLSSRLKLLGEQVTYLQEKGSPSNEILNLLENKVADLKAAVTRQLPMMSDLISLETKQIVSDVKRIKAGEKLYFGLPTGLAIDKVVPGGLPLGKIVTIYGESGNFKTTTKNNIVWGIASRNCGKVLDLSFEDDDILTTQRAIARLSGVGYGKIATRTLTDGDVDELVDLQYKAIADNIIMGAEHTVDVEDIINTARFYKNTQGLVAVVIDYVQLVAVTKEKLDQAIRLMQLAAKRDNLCYILVSQVKQDVDFRAANNQNARPRITDMLGSSSLRTAPKLSIGVYRPAKYHVSPVSNPGAGLPRYAKLVDEHPDGQQIYEEVLELWISKNIYGEQQVCVPVRVDPITGKMYDLPDEIKGLL